MLLSVEINSIIENEDPESDQPPFKGFLVQALDPQTFKFIGHFLPGEGLHLMPECSAVTHQNSKLKSAVGLLWKAPTGNLLKNHLSGEVIFRATVVQKKTVYYQNLLAEVAEDE